MYTNALLGKYRVILVAICANIVSFSMGTYVGWTSPVVPKLRNQGADSPLSVGVTPSQEGWIGSFTSVGAFAVCFLVGPMTIFIGRKSTLLISSIFLITSFVILLCATNIWFLYVARFLQGCGGGISTAVIPMYVGETATDDLRGALGSLLTFLMVGGILYVYAIGPYVSYMVLQWCCLVLPILFFVTFCFMPETPYYFAIKGERLKGINSLKFLRGKSDKDVEDEMTKIQSEVDADMCNKSRIIDILRNSLYRRALCIGCGLFIMQQLSGNAAVTLNAQSIFISAGSKLDPAIDTIILGVVQLIPHFLIPFVIERAGRKMLLIISAIGMCVSLVAIGTFFFVKEFKNDSGILWLPVTALVIYKTFFYIGFGPVPWVVLGEMFPSNIKPTAISIACATDWVTMFVVTRWFPELNALGPYYAFWIFSVFTVLAIFFVLFVVIETKGLSLQMIQEKLQRIK